MSIIPGKQVYALEGGSSSQTTDVLDTASATIADKEWGSVFTISGADFKRLFVRNIRLSRTASQVNSGAYGTYDGSQGFAVRVELWSWISDTYDYTTATIDDDGPNLLAWQQADTGSYDATVQSLVIDFPFSHWFGPTFPDVATSPFKFAVVVYDTSGVGLTDDSTRYDVKVEYDIARSS